MGVKIFTFHYASTYTGTVPELYPTYEIYIPLCFYLYRFSYENRKHIQYLHSTMLLLIRFLFGVMKR